MKFSDYYKESANALKLMTRDIAIATNRTVDEVEEEYFRLANPSYFMQVVFDSDDIVMTELLGNSIKNKIQEGDSFSDFKEYLKSIVNEIENAKTENSL